MYDSKKYLKILLNIFLLLLLVILIFFVVPKLAVFFMPFVIGWIIALIANPLVKFLENHVKIVRKHGSMIIIIFALTLVIGTGYLGISRIYKESITLIQNLPEIYTSLNLDIEKISHNFEGIYKLMPEEVQLSLSNIGEELSLGFAGVISDIGKPTFTAAGRFAKNIPSIFINIIITILAAYFFIVEKENITRGIKKFVSSDVLNVASDISNRLKVLVGGYFKAQFKIMGIVAVILFLGFLILDIDYSFLLALGIALLDFFPFFGTGAVLIPWTIFKVLTGDYRLAIGLFLIYIISQVVRQIVQPKVLGDTIGLNPLATLFFMFIGFKLGSVIGLVLAVPIGMILINFYEEGYFDNFIKTIKDTIKEINEFRRL
ncbi:MAG: hypothetical protein PWR23_473 [Peptostreptococcaceae bacterium]|nr:hypothetical protein [Peptostreptococcaceae bacterium]